MAEGPGIATQRGPEQGPRSSWASASSEAAGTRARRQLDFPGLTAGSGSAWSRPGVGLEMPPRDPAGHCHAPLPFEPGRVSRRGQCGLSPSEACPVLGVAESPSVTCHRRPAEPERGEGHEQQGVRSSRGVAGGGCTPFQPWERAPHSPPAPPRPRISCHGSLPVHPRGDPACAQARACPRVSPRPLFPRSPPAAAAPGRSGPRRAPRPCEQGASWRAGVGGGGGPLHARPLPRPLRPPSLAVLVAWCE